MHEASLVRSLLRQVEELLVENNGTAVDVIRVQIGPLAGVERELVQIAYAELVDASVCRGAELCIDQVPLTASCNNCACEFEVQNFRFRCPQCLRDSVRVTGGDEFQLVDVTMQADEVFV